MPGNLRMSVRRAKAVRLVFGTVLTCGRIIRVAVCARMLIDTRLALAFTALSAVTVIVSAITIGAVAIATISVAAIRAIAITIATVAALPLAAITVAVAAIAATTVTAIPVTIVAVTVIRVPAIILAIAAIVGIATFVVAAIPTALVILLLAFGLLAHRFAQKPRIMLGMLKERLLCHAVVGQLRIARQSQIFFNDLLWSSTHFALGPRGVKDAIDDITQRALAVRF